MIYTAPSTSSLACGAMGTVTALLPAAAGGEPRVRVSFPAAPQSTTPLSGNEVRAVLSHVPPLAWYSAAQACALVGGGGISLQVLQRISGNVLLNPGRVDVGLRIRFPKQQLQAAEYARRVSNVPHLAPPASSAVAVDGAAPVAASNSGGGGYYNEVWEYSELAVRALSAYRARFPLLFQVLHTAPHESIYNAEEVAGHAVIDRAAAQVVVNGFTQWLQAHGLGADSVALSHCRAQRMERRAVRVLEELSAKRSLAVAGLIEP